MRLPRRAEVARILAPAAFLLAVTVAILLVRAGLRFCGRRRDLDEGFGVVAEAKRGQGALCLLDELLLVPVRIHVPHQTPATAIVGIP